MLFFARWFLWPFRLALTLFAWLMISIVMVLWLISGFIMGRTIREIWTKGDLADLADGYQLMLHFVFLTSPKKE